MVGSTVSAFRIAVSKYTRSNLLTCQGVPTKAAVHDNDGRVNVCEKPVALLQTIIKMFGQNPTGMVMYLYCLLSEMLTIDNSHPSSGFY